MVSESVMIKVRIPIPFSFRGSGEVKIRPIRGRAPAARNTGAYPAPHLSGVAGEQGEDARTRVLAEAGPTHHRAISSRGKSR